MTRILSMSGQTVVFLWTVCIGLFSGAVYDCFRILRHYISHVNIVAVLEDLLYWLFVSGVFFYVFLNRNYGEIRGFCLLGTLLGMVLYFALISRYVTAGAKIVIDFIGKILSAVRKALAVPLGLLAKALKRPVKFMKNKSWEFVIFIKKVLHKMIIYVKMKVQTVIKRLGTSAKKV